MDAKGRMAIPAKYRDEIESRCGGVLVLTYSPFNNDSLFLYPQDFWEQVSAKIVELNGFDRTNQILQRRMLGGATETQPDHNGRIQVPAQLRSVTGLEKRVVMMGLGNRFEIWNEAARDHARRDELIDGPLDALPDLKI